MPDDSQPLAAGHPMAEESIYSQSAQESITREPDGYFTLSDGSCYRGYSFGASVAMAYGRSRIGTAHGLVEYGFRHHSAGPYGEDIKSPWLDSDSFLYVLASQMLGWKDIHASRTARPTASVRYRKTLSLSEHLYDLAPSIGRAFSSRLGRLTSRSI